MLRLRRSRIILALAAFTLFLLFHFKSIPDRWAGREKFVTSGSTPATPPQAAAPLAGGSKEEAQNYDGAPNGALAAEASLLQSSRGNGGLVFDTRPPPTPPAPMQATISSAIVKDPIHPTTTIVAPGGNNNNGPPASKQTTLLPAHAKVDGHGDKGQIQGSDESSIAGKLRGTGTAGQKSASPAQTVAGSAAGGPDNFGLTSSSTTTHVIHWTKLPEHFPVPEASIIPLPTGKEKKLPQVQHKFKDETALEKTQREEKQGRILAAFKKSWKGYVDHAWLHDELKPKSGTNRDPFCGWAATLVDSLDSLLIMGLEKEFAHALEGLAQIDFTTTTKKEIPLFETTIRYLGGLLSAYDLDQGKHKIILDKAVELAEVLMGAFDTPNRMPQTFYQWMPVFMEQPKRARTRVVMAELGSLSMEFTRLAQITENDKYYDAIARITDEFDKWQDNTKMPGLWPLYVDASGCQKSNTVQDLNWKQRLMSGPDHRMGEGVSHTTAKPLTPAKPTLERDPVPTHGETLNKGKIKNWDESGESTPRDDSVIPPPNSDLKKGKIKNWDDGKANPSEAKESTHPQESTIIKRQLEGAGRGIPHHAHSAEDADRMTVQHSESKVECLPQGLASPPGASTEEFSFGGMADSTYEYLPKQHLLLGGQTQQYQRMYEKAIDAANKYLLFRPMTTTEADILVIGVGEARDDFLEPGNMQVAPSLGHLLCFTGGMYGLGSKVFQRPEDLEIAKKLTDACVWAYNVTTSGIMPEGMKLVPCDDMKECPWNQTKWEYTIDPEPEVRIASVNFTLEEIADKLLLEAERASKEAPVKPQEQQKSRTNTGKALAEKRQVGGVDSDRQFKKTLPNIRGGRAKARMDYVEHKQAQDKQGKGAGYLVGGPSELQGTPTTAIGPTDQKEFVKQIVDELRLPIGIPEIDSKTYILRPEAIESVFYMYRITGDPIWREKGWRMWEAIEKATDTEYGASAIADVMDPPDQQRPLDEMESFWLAETLKYFYLLFSPESKISLDEYVLNTEAHPFKRPIPA